MKLVELTRDLRPWRAGDSALVPDMVADAMVKAGEAHNARPFPPVAAEATDPAERPRVLRSHAASVMRAVTPGAIDVGV